MASTTQQDKLGTKKLDDKASLPARPNKGDIEKEINLEEGGSDLHQEEPQLKEERPATRRGQVKNSKEDQSIDDNRETPQKKGSDPKQKDKSLTERADSTRYESKSSLSKGNLDQAVQNLTANLNTTGKTDVRPNQQNVVITGPDLAQARENDILKRKISKATSDEALMTRQNSKAELSSDEVRKPSSIFSLINRETQPGQIITKTNESNINAKSDGDLFSRFKDFLKGDFPKLNQGIFTQSNPAEKIERIVNRDNKVSEQPTASNIDRVEIPRSNYNKAESSQIKDRIPQSSMLEKDVVRSHTKDIQIGFSSAFEKRFQDKTDHSTNRDTIREVVIKSPELAKFIESVRNHEIATKREILPQVVKSIPEAVRMSADRYIPLSNTTHTVTPVDLKLLVPDTVDRLKKLYGIPEKMETKIEARSEYKQVQNPEHKIEIEPKNIRQPIQPKITETKGGHEDLKIEKKGTFSPSQTPSTPLISVTPKSEIPIDSGGNPGHLKDDKRKLPRDEDLPEFKSKQTQPSSSQIIKESPVLRQQGTKPPIYEPPSQPPQAPGAFPNQNFNSPDNRLVAPQEQERVINSTSQEEQGVELYDPGNRDLNNPALYNPYGVVEEREKFLKVLKVHTITGTVIDRDSGNGIPGVFVSGGNLGNAMTNLAGEFSFSNVPNGQVYTLGLTKNGYRIAPSILTATAYGPNHHQFTGEDVTIRAKRKGRFNRSLLSNG